MNNALHPHKAEKRSEVTESFRFLNRPDSQLGRPHNTRLRYPPSTTLFRLFTLFRSLTMPGPTASAHQVLVYSGPGVSPLSLSHTILTLSLLLLPHYTVQPITPTTLATQPWEPSCALLVFPGGRDLPYVDELSTKTKVTRRIREFVHQGGRYLGICAGAYFGSETVVFDQGGDMEVVGQRDLVSGYPTNNPLNHPGPHD